MNETMEGSSIDSQKDINFSLTLPKSSQSVTRALGVGDENQVTSVDILLFDSNGKFTYRPIHVSSIQSDPNNSDIKTFQARIPSGTFDLVILANSEEELHRMANTIAQGDTKESVLGKLIVTNSGKWNNDPSVAGYRRIPMFGEISSLTVGATTPANNPVTLVRMLAKIDVTLASSITNFQLKSIRLYHANTQGFMVPESNNWVSAQNSVTAPSIPSTSASLSTPIVYDGTEISSGRSCINQIYTFEASKALSTSLASGICLVIGGIYGSDNSETYYRVDFSQTSSNATTYLDLLRNHHYRVNISSVSDFGLSTPTAALNSVPVNIRAQVLPWNDAPMSDVVFDQQYSLGVSKAEYIFGPELIDPSRSDNRLSITTDYPAGWQIDKIVDDAGNRISWLTTDLNQGSIHSVANIQLLLSENPGSNARVGYVHLRAGRMIDIIRVTQLKREVINSYIVAPGGSVDIPLSMVNFSDLGTQWTLGDAVTAELFWTDNSHGVAANSNISSITIRGTFVHVETGSADGNAVVAVMKNREILWSWHIWVTNYQPVPIGSGKFMDRNLGAIGNLPGALGTFGLLYQWGRKDPFPGSSSVNRNDAAVVYKASGVITGKDSQHFTDLQTSIDNPLAYTLDDWSGSAGDFSWDSNGSKTAYDPCPKGWRVSSVNSWNGLDVDHDFPWDNINLGCNNFLYGGFYPACGYFESSRGALFGVGTNGGYWLRESFDSNNAKPLLFGNHLSTLLGIAPFYKKMGCSIRCVKE